jgi:hypothetical protein
MQPILPSVDAPVDPQRANVPAATKIFNWNEAAMSMQRLNDTRCYQQHPWRKSISAICAILLLGVAVISAPEAKAASPEQVEQTISVAKEALFKAQKNGTWEVTGLPDLDKGPFAVDGGQWGGLTSIATYALLAAGEPHQSARIRPAIEWLKKADIKGVYALGMRMQVWNFLPKNEARSLIDHDARLLLLALKSQGDNKGFYDYLVTPSGRYDHSVSQYGVLGLWAAAEAEQPFEVPEKFWELVENAWLRDQDKSGGWAYERGPMDKHPLTIPMTAAGVATLFITQDYVHGLEGVTCKGNIHNPGIEQGLKWMAEHFAETANNTYAWYGIERIGVASGLKYFGTIDWYHEGCNVLCKNPGAWNDHGAIPSTAFALLFLVRGRAPIVMNKLNYEFDSHGDKAPEAHWNQRPRDAANVSRFIGHETENFFNWQVVNLKVPADELHDAPIMYIAGDQPLDLKKEDDDKLRRYVEQGGLILCNADCMSANFLNSIIKDAPGKPCLARRLFPDYEVRKLPNSHPIYTAEMFQKKDWKDNLDLLAVGNGAREFMLIFSGGDPAKYWQTRAIGGRESYHQIMTDIFLYTTEKQAPRFKGQTYIVTENTALKATRTMKIARLKYAGTWDPEPGGWRRMAAYMHNFQSLDLAVEPVELGTGKLTPGEYKIAHLTGNVKFHLSDKQKADLKAFTDGGGLLVVDACGGSGEFASSAEVELGALFGADYKQAIAPLPSSDALYAAPKIEEVFYRRTAQKMLVGKLKSPQLRGISRDGKPVLYYSPQDLSVGLVGQTVDGIFGYSPESATEIMRNILLKGGGFEPMATPKGPAQPAANGPLKETRKPTPPPAKPKGKPKAK